MNQHLLRLSLFTLLLILSAACGTKTNPSPETEFTVETAVEPAIETGTDEAEEEFVSRLAEISSAKEAWEAHNIQAYQVNIDYTPIGNSPQLLQLQVQNNQVEVLTHDCIPEKTCLLDKNLDIGRLTIDAVLSEVLAMAEAENGDIRHLGHIAYHDSYDFPRIIQSSQGAFTFTDFKVLEE